MTRLACFKAYDVRGRVPEELDEELAYKIGRAYAAFLNPGRVALGRDVRTSCLPLAAALAADGSFTAPVRTPGSMKPTEACEAYLAHLLSYVDLPSLNPLKVVVNAGNGCAGPVLDRLEPHLPFHFIKVHHEPDPTYPHEVPNPLLPENRRATAEAVRWHGADVGLAWDGDFDRCFFFDEQGGFIEGYYIVGFLARHPGAAIIHDPRLTWNTIEMVREAGGVPIISKTGHAFIKERMRAETALYGGEISGHYYFQDFAYCDSGMIPWLLVLEVMSRSGQKLSDLIADRMARFPVSGEINRRLPDPDAALLRVAAFYEGKSPNLDRTDGLSLEFPKLALQSASLQHRTGAAPQRGNPRRSDIAPGKNRRNPENAYVILFCSRRLGPAARRAHDAGAQPGGITIRHPLCQCG